jgi:methylmalonyl-CoA/ethylmalonyl-CoA epimerase
MVKNFKRMKKEYFGEGTVTQIGLVVDDIEKYIQSFSEVLGMKKPEIILTDSFDKTHTEYNNSPTGAQAKLAFFDLKNISVELIEPVTGPSTWKEFLDTKGPGIHHIAFKVKKMEENIDFLQENEGKLVQKGIFEGGSYAYIDMSEKLGLIIELLSFNNE